MGSERVMTNKIIGFWSDSSLLENRNKKARPDFEEMYLAFLPNGKGFLEWIKLSEEIVITFTCSQSDDRINIEGLKQYVYRYEIDPKGKRMIEDTDSNLRESFQVCNGIGLLSGGSVEVETLEFSSPILGYRNRKFGLMSRDINEYRAVLKDVCLEIIDGVDHSG